MYWFTLPAVNTLVLAVKVMLPDTADGVKVAAGLDKAGVYWYCGMLVNVMFETVHVASVPPRTILIGLISLCVMISVSADCVHTIVDKMLLVTAVTAR